MADLFSADGWLNRMVAAAGDAIWTYVLVAILLLCAIWFTLRTKGVQFRMLGEMFRLLGESASSTNDARKEKKISPFHAFAVSMATRVGTGNLAGVATAIVIGGPGAVFWMWITALLGSATSFVESTLAQLFKTRGKDSFIGGPAYYISKGLGKKGLASAVSVLLIITFALANNAVQSNTICDAMNVAFGIDKKIIGLILCALTLVIIFGGIHRIANFSSVIVPIMALGYLAVALFVIVRHYDMIPQVIGVIVKDAFGARQAIGGGFGAMIMIGIKRGLFSNEAGEGSVPNVAATAATSHPVKQGLIQALGVFTDTIVICSCTAFIILFSGVDIAGGLNGIALTQAAMEAEIGRAGSIFIAAAILLFAYSTIIGNYYYGEANILYLTRSKKILTAYRLVVGTLVIYFGAIASLDLVWSIIDLFMAFLTACNLYAIARLGKYAFRLLDDYKAQRKAGKKDPEFHRSAFPEANIDCWE